MNSNNIEDNFNPALAKHFIAQLTDFISSKKWFEDMIEFELQNYFDISKAMPGMLEEILKSVVESYIFEADRNGKTPLEIFIDDSKVPSYEQLVYKTWLKGNVLSIFKVIKLNTGKSLLIKDLISNKEYFVLEKTLTKEINIGDIFCVRILPMLNYYVISGGLISSIPNELWEMLSLTVKKMKGSKLFGIDITRMLYGIRPPMSTNIPEGATIEDLKNMLLETSKKANLGITRVNLEALLNQDIDPEKILKKITKCKDIKVQEEILTLLDGINSINSSRDGSMSPGPMEKMLVNQMLLDIQNDLQKEQMANKLDSEEVVHTIPDKKIENWLNKKRIKFAFKTAKQIILDERKALNNPNKEFQYKVTFSMAPVDKSGDIHFRASQLLEKEHKYVDALALFSQLTVRDITGFEESYRILNNIATCLLNLGDKDLAYIALKKAVKINPKYEMAKNNLKEIERISKIKDPQFTEREILFMYWFTAVINHEWEFSSLANSELAQDIKVFLDYIESGKAEITKTRKDIKFIHCGEINSKFSNPESMVIGDDIGDGKLTFKKTKEQNFHKIFTLHNHLLYLDVIIERKQKLILTKKGKKVKENLAQLAGKVFASWTESSEFDFNFLVQNPVATIRILDYFKKHKQIDLRSKQVGELFNAKEEDDRWDIEFTLRDVFEMLKWMNVVKRDEKSIKESYTLTISGGNFIKEINTSIDNLIPKEIVNLLNQL